MSMSPIEGGQQSTGVLLAETQESLTRALKRQFNVLSSGHCLVAIRELLYCVCEDCTKT